MLESLYVNELMDDRKLNEIETIDTRTIINEIMPKFYDYIVAAELKENPYTATPTATTENFSYYFNKDTVREPRTSSIGVNIFRKRVQS